MQLRPTDLPDPVVPATSRCGIGARSAMTGSPEIFFPRISGRAMFWSSNAWLPTSSRQAHRLALGVRQLDADNAAAGDGRHARGQGRHVSRDIVGKLDHAARLDPACGLQLVHGDHGTGPDFDDVAADVEVFQYGFQQPGVAFKPRAVDLLLGLLGRRCKQVDSWQLIAVAEGEAWLGRGFARLAAPAGATPLAGSATATAGLGRGGAAAMGRSSAISVAPGRGTPFARLPPEHSARSSPFLRNSGRVRHSRPPSQRARIEESR